MSSSSEPTIRLYDKGSLPHVWTEIVCKDEDVFPNLSVAVQVTIVSPSGNTVGASLVIVDIST